jgi:hypothetical protein
VYGDHRIHEAGHIEAWRKFGIKGEYDSYPRGRVALYTRTCKFALLADRCILRQPGVVADIKKRLHLPADVIVEGDSHYVCPNCPRR